jgi:hypothetical protein
MMMVMTAKLKSVLRQKKRPRWASARMAAAIQGAGAAFIAGVAVHATVAAMRGGSVGFWLAIVLLLGIAVWSGFQAVRSLRSTRTVSGSGDT